MRAVGDISNSLRGLPAALGLKLKSVLPRLFVILPVAQIRIVILDKGGEIFIVHAMRLRFCFCEEAPALALT